VQLVNRYAELKSEQKQVNDEFDEELGQLEEALLGFAEKQQVDCVFGSKHKIRISDTEKCSFPSKNSKERKSLETLLQKHGKLAEVQQLDTTALGKIISEERWEPELLETVRSYIDVERKKRLYLSRLTKDE